MFDRNLPYNDLPNLPPSEEIIDKDVLIKWGLASRALAELNKNILRIPNPSMLINTISLQEAQASTAIENIFTTDDELYKAVSDSIKEETANPSIKEVLRYREALWSGYNLLNNNQTFDKTVAINIFQKIKNTSQTIRPPQSQVVIRRGQSDLKPGEIIYTPPRGVDIVDQKLANMFEFLNSTENSFDPLIKMAIAHYQFEAIHPFTDGNGRTGRIINLLYLVNTNLLSHPVLYLSKYIIEHKDDYYYLLAGITQRQDWKPWLIYMLTAVESTSKYSNQKIDEILLQMDATYSYIHPKLKWYSLELNLALFSQPYIKQKTIGEITGSRSRTTLTKYLQKLVELGVLSVNTDGREVFYLNNDLIRILQA
ncbi:MAG: Fic/DOC family protein [Bacteroidetes bacterium GWA2_31_9]|nr:MAG: Fic/DOC family protein [Bacteroidetes bacterium GWA2_31_9]